ncbi:MAG: adenylate kinase [Bacillota bacterium]|nr:adenylate kinase [Bacillota bacterium]
MKLILLGPPGAGKGTVAANVEVLGRCHHISTGELFRQHLRDNSPLGREVRSYMEAGELVPDELTVRLVEARIVQEDGSIEDFVLDGFPRTIPQAEALDELLERHGTEIAAVILLEVDDEEIVKRLSGRLVCADCGQVYNLESSPPKQAGVCDSCSGELRRRADDSEATVRQRLAGYHSQTEPLIDYYGRRGLVLTVDSSGSPARTQANVGVALADLIDRRPDLARS